MPEVLRPARSQIHLSTATRTDRTDTNLIPNQQYTGLGMKSFLLLVSILTACGCSKHPTPKGADWVDMGFVAMDESPKRVIIERDDQVVPSVTNVLLLPLVENYQHDGKVFKFALVDPIEVAPTEQSLRETFRNLTREGQWVRRAVVLARGYCPGVIQPNINGVWTYGGRQVIVVQLPKISDSQYGMAYRILIDELDGHALKLSSMTRTMDIWNFEDAIVRGELLKRRTIKSPVVHSGEGEYRTELIYWNVPDGTLIHNFLTKEGMALLKTRLSPHVK